MALFFSGDYMFSYTYLFASDPRFVPIHFSGISDAFSTNDFFFDTYISADTFQPIYVDIYIYIFYTFIFITRFKNVFIAGNILFEQYFYTFGHICSVLRFRAVQRSHIL